MPKYIDRSAVTYPDFREILDKETHHDHKVCEHKDETLYWEPNKAVQVLRDRMDLNDLLALFHAMGYGRNSELWRKLYRDMGMSLSGYYEVFYDRWNNELADEYVPNAAALPNT